MCKEVQDNFSRLFPYETIIRLAEGTRNNLAMATPLFAFSRKNARSKVTEGLVEDKRLGESTMLGGDLLL